MIENISGELDKTTRPSLSASDCTELQEMGRLFAERCELFVAADKYEKAAQGFWALGEVNPYLDCQNRLLRIYAELMDFERLESTRETLQRCLGQSGVELNAKSYYTLGISATYKKDFSQALGYFQKSLSVALAEDSKPDICYAINGLAITYSNQNRLQEALKEIYNLEIFFQVMPLEEVRSSSRILNAAILRKTKKFDEAKEVLWDCYSQIAHTKNFYQYIFLLYSMALLHFEAGDTRMAAVYVNLARKSCDPSNLVWLSKKIDELSGRLKSSGELSYDLIYEEGSSSIVEKRKGRVDFRNQFVLLDLLKLFILNPGEVFSKERLVKEVWKQEYNPDVHDNKIYVTIKRLRKLIEPDYDKPKYIFRGKNGYYLNKEAAVFLNVGKSPFEGDAHDVQL